MLTLSQLKLGASFLMMNRFIDGPTGMSRTSSRVLSFLCWEPISLFNGSISALINKILKMIKIQSSSTYYLKYVMIHSLRHIIYLIAR